MVAEYQAFDNKQHAQRVYCRHIRGRRLSRCVRIKSRTSGGKGTSSPRNGLTTFIFERIESERKKMRRNDFRRHEGVVG